MTTFHIAALHFDGRIEAAKKRLLKLKDAGLIGERPRNPFEPAVLFLARDGIRLLDGRGVLLEYPPLPLATLERRARVSELTLRHELSVIDVKVAMISAARVTTVFSVAEFSTWPLLNEFTAAGVTVKPDAFVRFLENQSQGTTTTHCFFLEVDRSTEALDSLVSRAASYLDFYHSGGFAERNHASPSAFRKFPFRVLMVFNTGERLNNVAERLLQTSPPILTHVWLTTLPELLGNPLGAIWVRPLDYRIATKDSRFDPDAKTVSRRYARDTARGEFVAELGWVSNKKLPFAACVTRAYDRAMEDAKRLANPPTEPAPAGRVTVEGEIISLREQSSDYGTVWKMLVRLASGSKVWCSVPSEATRKCTTPDWTCRIRLAR